MQILVVGATGLIGSALSARLTQDGHTVIGVARHPGNHVRVSRWVPIDLAFATSPENWLSSLSGIDAVVNCAGVLQDSSSEKMEAVHTSGANALFTACEQAGVRRVVHLSAIGVNRAQPSSFSATKYSGDRQLMAKDLDWVILRPSVVLGRSAAGASALIRGLAGLPFVPLMPRTMPMQVVQLDDVLATIAFFLKADAPARVELDLAGPDQLQMGEVIAHYRKWYGWPRARVFIVPTWLSALAYRLGDLASTLGWISPIRSNAALEIGRGAVGDSRSWILVTRIEPTSLSHALAAEPAPVQEKWFARLYFLKALIIIVLSAFWILTGVISLSLGYATGVELMASTGAGILAGPFVVAGALTDIAVGVGIAWRRWTRYALYGALLLSLFYAVAGSILRPDLWIEPLGPLMKIVPIFVLHLVALATLDER